MNEIKNIILCGFGAIGSVYASKLLQNTEYDFRVLVDDLHYRKYLNNPVTYNGTALKVNFILPQEEDFKSDLIIIATKMSGLNSALNEIKNFVSEDTVILSLLNGVTSEQIIADRYGREKVLYSYFIGHSSVRTGNSITHDGVNTLVFGSDNKNDIDNIEKVKVFCDKVGINYQIANDIKHSMWLKFMLNVCANPTTALFRMSFGEMLNNESMMGLAIKIMKEVQAVAKAEGVNNTEFMVEENLEQLKAMSPEGKTSMFQDVINKRKTEADIFVGTVSELGKKHNISTPYCDFLNDAFNVLHEQFSK